MNRRDALARVALLMGGTVIGADYFLTGCSSPAKKEEKAGAKAAQPAPTRKPEILNAQQVTLLDEVGETILPATKTPGAKAAHVGQFMAVMVRDCYEPKDQKVFLAGLAQLDADCHKKQGKAFLASTPAERTAFLTALDAEQKAYSATQPKDAPNHYFRMMKQLTLLGFFTSEVGATQALRYLPIPGRYDGSVPYKKGDRAWAS